MIIRGADKIHLGDTCRICWQAMEHVKKALQISILRGTTAPFKLDPHQAQCLLEN